MRRRISELKTKLNVVRETLADIGAEDVPSILVMNKCDRAAAVNQVPGAEVAILASALNGTGLDEIKEAISDALSGCYPNR